ncbi:mucin-binding protein [Limosilactobacillus fermentum]
MMIRRSTRPSAMLIRMETSGQQHTDSVNFTRTVVVDNVTGEVITSWCWTTAWTATNGDTTFDAVVSPVVLVSER